MELREQNRPPVPPTGFGRGKPLNSKPPRPPTGVGHGRTLKTSPIPQNHPVQFEDANEENLNLEVFQFTKNLNESLMDNHPPPLRRPEILISPAQLLNDKKDLNGNECHVLKMNGDDTSNISKTSRSSYNDQIKALREEKQRLHEKMKFLEKNLSQPQVPLMGFGRGKPLNSKTQTSMNNRPPPLRRPKDVSPPVQLSKDEKDLNGNERPVLKMNDKDSLNVSKISKSSYSGQIKALREEKQRLLEKMELPEKNWSRPPVPLMGFGRGKPLNSKPQTLMDDNPTPLRRPKVVPTPVLLFKDEKNIKENLHEFSKVKEEVKQDSNFPKTVQIEKFVEDSEDNEAKPSWYKFVPILNKTDVNKFILKANPIMGEANKNSSNLSLEKSFNLLDFIQTLPHTGSKFLKVDMTMKITKLGKPIGIALLPKSKKIVIGDTASNQVKMFSHKGAFLKYINPPDPFKRPSDMIAFTNDEFAIKDNVGIHLFDENGDFQKSFINPELGKLFGLATDGKNHLFTINTNTRKTRLKNVTKVGETDIIVMEKSGSGEIFKRIELVNIITNISQTACRFLHYTNGKLFIVDLGRDRVYVSI